ncbi:MAG: M18 family aminopeptidase [Ilumatobacteraceae bacterium]|nr:M18 family aminopeptidase [Ilumatobacteraceae bacterium]
MADISGLLRFLDGSPSPSHAVASSVKRLTDSGFEHAEYRTMDPSFFAVERGVVSHRGAAIVWSWPTTSESASKGALVVGAHTDSPCLRVKPRPDSTGAGLSLLEVEVYGGVLLNSWLDRDLGAAGVVFDGSGAARLIDERNPVARIPQLAIHLDRDVNEKGLQLNRQLHMRPLWSTGERNFLEHLGVDHSTTGFDIVLFDVTPARLVGASADLIASGRLDNLVSCWAGVEAAVLHDGSRPFICALFDHEEVGSESSTGAAGPLLETAIDELLRVRGRAADRFDFLRRSLCISADNAHALHPNYPDRHDARHAPLVNRGPALKTNSNQRYATSGAGAGMLRAVAQDAGIPLQEFVSNNAMPCGSTIGPITATRLGIETIDVGVPQLAMHSARETCGANDPLALRDLLVAVARSNAF